MLYVIVDKCRDLTYTKKYALTEGPKPGGGRGELTWATCSAPQSFYACYAPVCSKSLNLGSFPDVLVENTSTIIIVVIILVLVFIDDICFLEKPPHSNEIETYYPKRR